MYCVDCLLKNCYFQFSFYGSVIKYIAINIAEKNKNIQVF